MGLFKKSDTSKKLHHLDRKIASAFHNVKTDTQNIYQWLNHFHQHNKNQEHLIKELKLELKEAKIMLKHMPRTREQLRQIIDSHYSLEPILERIKLINERVDNLTHQQKPITANIHEIRQQVSTISKKPHSLKEKIVKKLTRNSKRYVKNIIISLIQKYQRIPALQLREIVVEEQALCSKSSFYRLLTELEEEDAIDVIQEGKEKIYVFNAIKHSRK